MTARILPIALLAIALAACDEPASPFGFLATSDTGATDVGGGNDAAADAERDGATAADAGTDPSTGDSGADSGADAADDARDVDIADVGIDASDDPSDDAAVDTLPDVPDDSGADTAPDTGDDPVYIDEAPGGATVVTIGTFNVARFFDTVCDTGRCGDDDYEYQPSEPQFAYRAFQISEGIRMMDVDVVLLQEVETAACLDEIAAALGDGWVGREIGEMDFAASLDVAVLSRHPVTSVTEYRDRVAVERPDGSSTTFAREFLEVRLDVDGEDVLVFTSHFKSKNNDDPGRRFGEAASARDIVLSRAAANPNALVVFGGDLNDTPGSDPIDELERLGGLVRVAEVLGDRDGTITFAGQRQAIDHLYLATDGAGQVVRGDVRVVRDASGNLGGSDHAALRATFVLP